MKGDFDFVVSGPCAATRFVFVLLMIIPVYALITLLKLRNIAWLWAFSGLFKSVYMCSGVRSTVREVFLQSCPVSASSCVPFSCTELYFHFPFSILVLPEISNHVDNIL